MFGRVECRLEKAREGMSELSELLPSPQAKRYRDRAADARRDAAMTKGAARRSYLIIADQWERLATGVEAFIKSRKPD
jgi:hypothetical protein